jgi:DNA-binding TFAR19-related protein (PDSD5 family)
MGGMKSKVDEQTLITYLEQMNEGDKPTTSIKVKLINSINF